MVQLFKLFALFACIAAAHAQTFQIPVPTTVPVTVNCNGGVASASGSNVACTQVSGGTTPPQCPSPPGAGPCNTPPPQCPSPPGAGPCEPPPSQGWNGTCPGFNITRHLVMNWANPQRLLSGGFAANDIVVVEFTTGTSPSSGNALKISGAEYQGPPTHRTAALSDKPCDFVGLLNPATGTPWLGGVVPNSTSVTVTFLIDNPANGGFYPILHTNTKYFFSVKMPNGCQSPTGSCDMAFDLNKYNNQ